MFTRLQKAGIKVNASKSCFGAHKAEYLGYHVTCDGVMPIPKKVESIQALTFPNSQTTASVYQYDQLLLWHVAKALWASRPINCINFQKCQIWLERQAPKVCWSYQKCDRMWSIVELPGLQCSVWNTFWCFQTTTWRSHIPKGQAYHFLFTKDEQLPT